MSSEHNVEIEALKGNDYFIWLIRLQSCSTATAHRSTITRQKVVLLNSDQTSGSTQ